MPHFLFYFIFFILGIEPWGMLDPDTVCVKKLHLGFLDLPILECSVFPCNLARSYLHYRVLQSFLHF